MHEPFWGVIMKKAYKNTIICAIIIILIAAVVLSVNPKEHPRVIVERGVVELWTGDSWESFEGEERLKIGQRIRTLDGDATIVLDNLITILEPNSEVTLAELTPEKTVLQTKGSTWSKVLKLVQGQEVQVEHPSVVAMVRGTSFGVGDDGILCGEGLVLGLLNGTEYFVGGLQMLHPNGTTTPADPAIVREKLEMTLQLLIRERERELSKHRLKIKAALAMSGTTETVPQILEKIDSGQYNYKEALKKSPIPLDDFERAIVLTDRIVELRAILESL